MHGLLKTTLLSIMLLASPGIMAAEVSHILPGSPAGHWTPRLLLREQAPASGDRSHPVLYVHGASFPSELSIMFRFEGTSWADDLNERGYDVFGLDFAGYGGSERYPGMLGDAPMVGAPLGRAPDAAVQVERAVRYIMASTGAPRVTIIAHSWGTIVAALFATRHPELVDRLVLFGAIVKREGPAKSEPDAWSLVTIEEQHTRFVGGVPKGHAGVLVEQDFPRWARTYLATDPTSGERHPASVKVPSGPSADVLDAWSGKLAYDPSRIMTPTLIVSGAWDGSSTPADAAWLAGAMSPTVDKTVVTVPDATHLMHLESGRRELYRAVDHFLEKR